MSLSLCDLHFVSETFRDDDKGAALGSHLAMCLNSLLKPANGLSRSRGSPPRAGSTPPGLAANRSGRALTQAPPDASEPTRHESALSLRGFAVRSAVPAACFLEVFACTRGQGPRRTQGKAIGGFRKLRIPSGASPRARLAVGQSLEVDSKGAGACSRTKRGKGRDQGG